MLSEVFQNLLLASRDAAMLALAIGILLLAFGRWIAPAWRHWLWLLVALRLVLPVLPTSPTSWQRLVPGEPPEAAWVSRDAPDDGLSVPVSSGEASRQISTALFPEGSAPGSPEATAPVLPELEKESPRQNPWATLTAWDLLGIVWVIGLVIVLGLIGAVTLRFVRRLRRLTIDDHPQFGVIHSLLGKACGEAGLRRVPRLRITEAVLSPALTGLFRPEILLPPATIEKLDVSELRLVLLHELGHLRRRDVWTNWVLSLLQAVHWFNPLVWWAFHRTRIESERATDSWVLEHSGEGQAGNYGQALIHLLESSARPSVVPGVVGVIESRRDLRKRLLAIGRFTGKRSRLAVLGGIALLLGIAAVGLTQAPVEKDVETVEIDLPAGVPLPEDIVVPVETRANVKITVTDSDGKKIEGADVTVTVGNDPLLKIQSPLLLRGKTGADGVFAGESQPFRNDASFGHLAVIVISDQGCGFTMVQPGQDQRKQFPWNWDSLEAKVRISPVGEVPVRIMRPDGTPAAGVRVWVDAIAREVVSDNGVKFSLLLNPPRLSNPVWQAVSDENGECSISGIPLDSQVHLQHDQDPWAAFQGYHRILVDGIKPSGERTVLSLQPASSVSGKVVSPSGKGVPDVVIEMIEQDPYVTAHHAWAISDSEGKYQITSLPPGRYRVFAWVGNSLQKYSWIVKGGPVHLEVGEAQDKKGLGFEVVRGGKVVIRFIDAETGEFIREHPMGVREEGMVDLYYSGLPPKGYHRNHEHFEAAVVTGETTFVDLPFVPIKPTDQISGTVVDESGAPVPGAQVKLLKPQNIFPSQAFQLCDKNGKFSFDLPSGTETVNLLAWKNNSVSDRSADYKAGSVVSIELQKNGFGSASGRVVDSEGKPLEGASISFSSEWLSVELKTAQADKSGNFRVENIVPESHVEFFASKEGYGRNVVQEEVKAGENTKVGEIPLPLATEKVAGRVIDSAGKPVSNARITISGELQPDISTNTSRDGKFELGGVVEGWLWLEAGINSGDNNLFLGKKRVHSGSEDVEIILGEKPDKWAPEKIVDFTGKTAPPLQIAKWYHTDGLSPVVEGKVRVVRFIGIDRPLIHFSKPLKSLEKLRDQYKGDEDLEIVTVHGSWPREEVEEILATKYPDFDIPLGIESDINPASRVFGVQSWLSVVIDRDGKVALQTTKWSEVKAKVDGLMGNRVAGTSKIQSSKPGAKEASAKKGGGKNNEEESKYEQDFQPQPVSSAPPLRVVQPDGQSPAIGAKMSILYHVERCSFMDLTGSTNRRILLVAADKKGGMNIPDGKVVPRAWIVHKSGYRQIDEQFLKEMDGKPIQLLPFGEVEGTLKLDGKLVAGRKLQFEAPIPQLGDPTKFDFWGVTVQTGKKGEFRTDQLVPWDQPYRVYLVDDVTGEKSPERVAEMQVKSGAVGQVEIDYDEASLVRVKGRFVDTKGDSFESQGLGVVNVLAIPVNGRSPMNAQIRPEKDSVFLTGPIRPGHYYLDGKIVGKSGRGGRFALSDWRVPADAVTKAKDGIYDMGDVSLAWPSGGDSTVEEMSTPGQVTIQVVDAGSKRAIEGAAINPRGLYIGSSTLGWDPRTDKPGPETVTTGADGKAVLHYPEKLVGDRIKGLGDPMVIAVRLRVSHPDFLTEGTVRYNVDGSSPAIELKKGATLRVSATLLDGKGPVGEQLMVQVTDIRHSFESDAWRWEEMPGGQGRQRVHHLVPPSERIVRVAHRDKKGRLFFSDPEVIKFEKQEAHQLRAKLRMGRPFSGKLDGKIPRPVKGAWVTVMVAPENENWDNLYGALRWQSTADVAGDGSFRFDYLPPGKLAIAAGCDGWAHAIDQTGSSRSTVQYVSSREREDATIRMVEVGACRVLLTKPDGSPLPNASVSFWPNQSWPGRGSTIFGRSRYSTEWGFDTEEEKKQEDALLKPREQVPESAWSGTADAEGMVVIGNLPFSKEEIFKVEHPEYRLPADIHGQRYGRVKVESGKTVEVTLKMEEIGNPEKRAATTAPDKKTEKPSNGAADVSHASRAANVEAEREFQVEPFVPGDFKETVDGGVKVFTATVSLEKDELKAQVFFSEDSTPDVRLSILTSRILPQKKGIEPGMKKIPVEVPGSRKIK